MIQKFNFLVRVGGIASLLCGLDIAHLSSLSLFCLVLYTTRGEVFSSDILTNVQVSYL